MNIERWDGYRVFSLFGKRNEPHPHQHWSSTVPEKQRLRRWIFTLMRFNSSSMTPTWFLWECVISKHSFKKKLTTAFPPIPTACDLTMEVTSEMKLFTKVFTPPVCCWSWRNHYIALQLIRTLCRNAMNLPPSPYYSREWIQNLGIPNRNISARLEWTTATWYASRYPIRHSAKITAFIRGCIFYLATRVPPTWF